MARGKLEPGMKEKQWKKGQSGNPQGARLHDPVRRELKRITRTVFNEIVECALTQDLSGLKRIAEDKQTPAIQVGVATALAKAIKDGDWRILREIVEQLTGKPVEEQAIRFPDGLPAQPQTTVTKVILTLPRNGKEAKS